MEIRKSSNSVVRERPQIASYEMVMLFKDNYEVTVYLALDEDNRYSVVKRYKDYQERSGINTPRDCPEMIAMASLSLSKAELLKIGFVVPYAWTTYMKALYFATPLVDGFRGKEFVESGLLTSNQIIRSTASLLHMLEIMNKYGLAHNDISLLNIMVTSTGKTYLYDFGEASTIGERDSNTDLLMVLGLIRTMTDKLEMDESAFELLIRRAHEMYLGGRFQRQRQELNLQTQIELQQLFV